MPYGLKYFAEFNTISSQNLTFRLEINKKDYTGDETEITLTSTGCIQEWQQDDPFAPIKGCTLNIGIINDGSVSLEDFYSENDDEFYVEFIRTDTMMTLFRGYILQDDSDEVVLDYAHEINIVATDNLGTLKDVLLINAAEKYGTPVTYVGVELTANGASFYTNRDELGALKPGMEFIVSGSIYVGTYQCVSIQYDNALSNWVINTGQGLPNFGLVTSEVTFNNPIDISDYVTLLTLVRLCLKSTNITCGLNVATKLYPQGGTVERWLDSTVVYGGTFLTDNSSDNCYDVLEKIMSRFNATLFQTWGEWQIVRFGELFRGNILTPKYAIESEQYTDNFVYLGPGNENHLFEINKNEVETGLLKSIIRPYKFVSEKFDFVEQRGLVKNTNLAQLGDLTSQQVVGSNTVYDYKADWYNVFPGFTGKIEVTKNSQNIEISRYLRVTGDSTDPSAPFAVKSDVVQITAGTKITISYDLRVNDITISPGYAGNYPTFFVCEDGVNTYYLKNDGTFSTGFANIYDYVIAAPGDLENWKSLSVEMIIPFDCVFYFYFRSFNANPAPNNKTYYRNIQFTAEGNFIENSKTVGQIHTQTQSQNIKNVLQKDIGLDNAPSGIIKGALFVNQFVPGTIRQQLAGNWVFKCGEEISKEVTFYTTSTEEPFGFVFLECPLIFNEGDTFTISGVNEFFDREWTAILTDIVNGIGYVYVEGIEFGTSEGPLTGLMEYNEPDKIFTSIGEYSVKEQLFNFQKPRYKYNGTLLYINDDERTISNLSLFYFNEEGYGINNIMPVGSIAIDYRNEIANFTMWALFEQLEDPWCDFANFVNTRIYNFSYIYDIKQ
jgi:hypothetical protein